MLPHLLVAAVVGGRREPARVAARRRAADRGRPARPRGRSVRSLAAPACSLAELFTRARRPTTPPRAARLITRGRLRARFWGGVVAAGIVAAAALLLIAGAPLGHRGAGRALLALAGLWLWEDSGCEAGQSVPLS